MRVRNFVSKLGRKARRVAGVAVVAGGMAFAGSADAAMIFEDFESATTPPAGGGGAAGQLGGGTGGDWGAYRTDQNYSASDHTTALAGAGGSFYGHTISVAANPQSDPVAIDAGHTQIYVEAWMANWTGDGDHTLISILQFSDAAGTTQVGSTALVLDDSGNATTNAWNFQSGTTPVEAGAVSFRLQYGGVGNDTYADNILARSQVPEPGSLALLGLGGVALVGLARRKK